MRPGTLMVWPSRLLLVVLLGLLSVLSVVVAGVSLHAHAAPAATLTVTDCTGETGPGRIGTVISNASAGDTITFSCSGTIPITSTLTISTNNLTLDGSGQTVTLDGQHAVQVLAVPSGVTFTLNALTIANGRNTGIGGGGLANNGGTVTITNSTFTNNSSEGPGGGLANNGGTVTITNSTFTNNFATSSGGGLLNSGTVTITNSTFTNNNSAGSGGGLLSDGGTVTITNSTFTNNSSDGTGGGLNNGGTVTITNSTFANNSSSAAGGGLSNRGTVTITNSTFANNHGSNTGGGLLNSGTVTITNSTIANNSAVESDGGGLSNGGTVNIGGSIVANNTGGNCTGASPHDNGYNLSNDTSCAFTASTSLQNTDPKLDPAGLQNNGGPTQTIALEPDSPAVDKIPVGSSCPATDQRGVSRPQGPACDIGAFEMTAADGLTVMIHVVNSFQLSHGLQTSLDAKLQAALSSVKAGNTSCGQLGGFSDAVQAQSGKGLTTTQATQLVNEATVITTRLGC